MNLPSLLLCAVALSMDAFAVAICKGLAIPKINFRKAAWVGLWFGVFQALMPTLGYFLTSLFAEYIAAYTHWVAFILLALIGLNMVKESFEKEEEKTDDSLGVKTMLLLAIATSIDALAVGVAFALGDAASPDSAPTILYAAPLIGCITFLLSCLGVKVGNLFGTRYKSRAELCGGIVLILLGVKTLLEGLGVIDLPI